MSAAEADISEAEREALDLVRERRGIHQSDLWKELDISSRKGSRIVESLVEQELVERQEAVYQGHTTYFIEPAAADLDFSLLMAGDMLSPLIGEEEIDPESDAFSQWLMSLSREE